MKYTENPENEENADLLLMMQSMFVRRNQSKFDELKDALASGDTPLAHRIVHNLKSNAAYIGKDGLRKTAAQAEDLLKSGGAVPDELVNRLGAELAQALEELAALPSGQTAENRDNPAPDDGQTSALLDRLEHMLAEFDPDCFNLLDQLRAVPGTEILAYQIEEYDLKSAQKTLAEIREKRRKRCG